MEAKHDVVVNELNLKIESLIDLYTRLLSQKKDLEQRIAKLEGELALSKASEEDLVHKLKISQFVDVLAKGDKEEVRDARMRINRLVREIDKCIALLNN